EVTRVFDTQVAAGFLGMGGQESYESLVKRVLGVRLRGGEGFTHWDRRPLTERQVAYATDDARCLLALGEAIEGELVASGRLEWAREECVVVQDAREDRSLEGVYARLPQVEHLGARER